jgi:hypothetical protein
LTLLDCAGRRGGELEAAGQSAEFAIVSLQPALG